MLFRCLAGAYNGISKNSEIPAEYATWAKAAFSVLCPIPPPMGLVYLPTWKVDFYRTNVGKYTIHGSYGCFLWVGKNRNQRTRGVHNQPTHLICGAFFLFPNGLDETQRNERIYGLGTAVIRGNVWKNHEEVGHDVRVSDVKRLQELARKQIVLGGYRLGDFLRLVAQQGGEAQPRRIDDSLFWENERQFKQCFKDIDTFHILIQGILICVHKPLPGFLPARKQSGWDNITKIFAALTAVFATLFLVLMICFLKLRRKMVTSPRDVATFELNAAVDELRGTI